MIEKFLEKLKTHKQSISINLGLLAILIVVTATVTILYISNEKFFYFWDYANYSNQTSELAFAFRTSISEGIRVFQDSLTTDYNKVPCLPLVPFALIFGESRLVYILSVALVYIVPFCLVVGAIATKLIPVYPRAVFWSTAFLSLLLTPTWTPTLRGYPDMGGAVIIGLTIFVYLQDIYLRQWWRVPSIGFLLALSMLFRRHFAYSARAFLMAMVLQGLLIFILEFRRDLRRAFSNLTRYGILISLVAISNLIALIILNPIFLQNLLNTNYRVLYASYDKPLLEIFYSYLYTYGYSLWILAMLGFLLGIITHTTVYKSTFFIFIFGIISLIQWWFLSRQIGNHYTTHFNWFIILGLTSLCWTIILYLKNKIKLLLLSFIFLLLITNILYGLTKIRAFVPAFDPWFSGKIPPMVRKDYAQFAKLIEYLRTLPASKNIKPPKILMYVAASSQPLNPGVVQESEWQLHGRNNSKIQVLPSPDVDSRDFYPLNSLLQAEYVLVGVPFQYHLSPEEHDIVKFVVDEFTENWELSRDFKRLSGIFMLGKDDRRKNVNISVLIYQRIRETSLQTILKTIEVMQEKIDPKPGNESDWLIVDKPDEAEIWNNRNGTINLHANVKSVPTSFLYFGSMPELVDTEGKIKITMTGTVKSASCEGFDNFSLRLSTLTSEGQIVKSQDFLYSAKSSDKLSLSLEREKANYLLLQFIGKESSDRDDSCSVYIDDLAVSTSKI